VTHTATGQESVPNIWRSKLLTTFDNKEISCKVQSQKLFQKLKMISASYGKLQCLKGDVKLKFLLYGLKQD